jgi:hypothetical protein
MPAQHLPAPPAIQADNIVAVNGSPDRHRRGSLDKGFCCGLTEVGQRVMDGRDKGPELVGWDLIASNIGGDDLRCEFGRLLVGHRSPLSGQQRYTHPG